MTEAGAYSLDLASEQHAIVSSMDERYEGYFDQEWETFPSRRPPVDQSLAQAVQRAVARGIERADIPTGVTVRSDAKTFLAVNLYEMVARPANQVDRSSVQGLISDALPSDTQRIVADAGQQAAQAGEAEVSAHRILRAVARQWSNLNFAAPWRWEERQFG